MQAYYDCRRTKRNTASALAFEAQLERNLCDLYDELAAGRYRPGRSICFVITRPKPREVWAAEFRDRIAHHFLYNAVGPAIEATFVADSCACIPGRGSHSHADRARLANLMRRRGHCVAGDLTQTFRKPQPQEKRT